MHLCMTFFNGGPTIPTVDDCPESGTIHVVIRRAFQTMFERSASHLDTVLLLGQLRQLAIDQIQAGLPLAHDETFYLR